ncbi:MAG: hypothetical protein ACR2GY_10500 [Phycisphaerales bacterium]
MDPQTVLENNNLIPILAITLGCAVAIVWIVFATVYYIIRDRAREITRREVAAYVAEGSIDKATAVALLTADPEKIGDACKILGAKSG